MPNHDNLISAIKKFKSDKGTALLYGWNKWALPSYAVLIFACLLAQISDLQSLQEDSWDLKFKCSGINLTFEDVYLDQDITKRTKNFEILKDSKSRGTFVVAFDRKAFVALTRLNEKRGSM